MFDPKFDSVFATNMQNPAAKVTRPGTFFSVMAKRHLYKENLQEEPSQKESRRLTESFKVVRNL
jgi:hypothetical protein